MDPGVHTYRYDRCFATGSFPAQGGESVPDPGSYMAAELRFETAADIVLAENVMGKSFIHMVPCFEF
jgi:hypothetical protein